MVDVLTNTYSKITFCEQVVYKENIHFIIRIHCKLRGVHACKLLYTHSHRDCIRCCSQLYNYMPTKTKGQNLPT